MAGKHRAEASDSSNTVVKVAGLAGIAVAASLLSAGSASASPFGGLFHKPAPSSSTPSASLAAAPTGGGFFTSPDPAKPIFGFGSFITKTNPVLTTGGIPYITTTSGTKVVTGFCLNRKGCN